MIGEPQPSSHWRITGAQGTYRHLMNERPTLRLDARRIISHGGLVQQSNHRPFGDLHILFDDPEREEVCTALGVEKEFFPLNTGRSWGIPLEGRPYDYQPVQLETTSLSGRFFNNIPIDIDGEDIEDGADLDGWLLCTPGRHTVLDRENLNRCMRITILINLFQRYHNEDTSLEWFKRIQAHEGLPVIPDDEADDRAWEMLGQPADPLSFLSLYELQRLYTFTLEACSMSSWVSKNDHNGFVLRRVMPLRIVRTGQYPEPFCLCQPIGLRDVDTMALSPRMVRVVVPGLNDEYKAGCVLLTDGSGVDLTESLWDFKRTINTQVKSCPRFDIFNDPTLSPLLAISTTPPKYGWDDDGHHTFSSSFDVTAHLLAETQAYTIHDGLFEMTNEIEDGADPEGFVPTWKDRRPLAVVDFAKPKYPHWSDLLKCKACNQRVRVLLPSGNTLTYVQCPSCKDERGINTEHLMNNWKPQEVALSVRKGQGETMLE
jgi:hypothetical protein